VIAQGLGIVFHREVEGFLNRKTEFQRIHRIQAKAIVSKKRSVVANISGGDVFQSKLIDDELFELQF